jgi:hypothetical protein
MIKIQTHAYDKIIKGIHYLKGYEPAVILTTEIIIRRYRYD